MTEVTAVGCQACGAARPGSARWCGHCGAALPPCATRSATGTRLRWVVAGCVAAALTGLPSASVSAFDPGPEPLPALGHDVVTALAPSTCRLAARPCVAGTLGVTDDVATLAVPGGLAVADLGVVRLLDGDAEIRWERKVDGRPVGAVDGHVLLEDGGVVTALRLADGGTSWTVDEVDGVRGTDVRFGTVHVDPDGAVALHDDDGRRRWRAGAGQPAVREIHGVDGSVLVRRAAGPGGGQGRLVARSASSGAAAWDVEVPDVDPAAPPGVLAAGGLVLAAGAEVRAVDGLSGHVRWSRRMAGPVSGLSSVSGQVVATGSDTMLVADPSSGHVVARTRLPSGILRLESVAASGAWLRLDGRLVAVRW